MCDFLWHATNVEKKQNKRRVQTCACHLSLQFRIPHPSCLALHDRQKKNLFKSAYIMFKKKEEEDSI